MFRFIETNWKLAPLSTRDKQSAGLASAFDFTAAPRPPASLPWTWPAPVVRAATNSPAPVIYSIYGVAAGARDRYRGPCHPSSGTYFVPTQSRSSGDPCTLSLKSVGERTERFVRGSRYPRSSPAALASTPAGDIAAGSVPFSDVGRASLRVAASVNQALRTRRNIAWASGTRGRCRFLRKAQTDILPPQSPQFASRTEYTGARRFGRRTRAMDRRAFANLVRMQPSKQTGTPRPKRNWISQLMPNLSLRAQRPLSLA